MTIVEKRDSEVAKLPPFFLAGKGRLFLSISDDNTSNSNDVSLDVINLDVNHYIIKS